jgi:hypothetical protein
MNFLSDDSDKSESPDELESNIEISDADSDDPEKIKAKNMDKLRQFIIKKLEHIFEKRGLLMSNSEAQGDETEEESSVEGLPSKEKNPHLVNYTKKIQDLLIQD